MVPAIPLSAADQILQVIRGLPIRERLRLVERIVHDLTDAPVEASGELPDEPSPLGLFADDPDEVDEMMKIVSENRRRWKLWTPEGEDEPSPA